MDEIDAAFYFELATPRPRPVFRSAEIRGAFGTDRASHLGTGTFGETWKIGSGDGERAIKIIHRPNYPLVRLRREIEGLRRVDSANVVKLFAVRAVVLRAIERVVLEFEYVDGGDANSLLTAGEWPGSDQIRAFVRGIAGGLATLHQADTIHRDLKFGNVALRFGRWREPVILDLGLARKLDDPTWTQYPQLLGTLPFMSPEQVRGESARKAADLWALGVMAFILLERRHPFYLDRANGLSRAEAIDRLEAGPPIPKNSNSRVASLTTRLLQPQPYKRGTAARLFEELAT